MPYEVKETPCFPAKWKVQPLPPLGDDNSTGLFFRERPNAQACADAKNHAEKMGAKPYENHARLD